MKLESLDLKALLLPHSGSVFRDIETGMTECLKYYRNSSQHSSLTSSQFQSLNIACAQSYTDPIKNILFKCYSWQNMPLTSFKYRTASTGRQKRKKPLISHLNVQTQPGRVWRETGSTQQQAAPSFQLRCLNSVFTVCVLCLT